MKRKCKCGKTLKPIEERRCFDCDLFKKIMTPKVGYGGGLLGREGKDFQGNITIIGRRGPAY